MVRCSLSVKVRDWIAGLDLSDGKYNLFQFILFIVLNIFFMNTYFYFIREVVILLFCSKYQLTDF